MDGLTSGARFSVAEIGEVPIFLRKRGLKLKKRLPHEDEDRDAARLRVHPVGKASTPWA